MKDISFFQKDKNSQTVMINQNFMILIQIKISDSQSKFLHSQSLYCSQNLEYIESNQPGILDFKFFGHHFEVFSWKISNIKALKQNLKSEFIFIKNEKIIRHYSLKRKNYLFYLLFKLYFVKDKI